MSNGGLLYAVTLATVVMTVSWGLKPPAISMAQSMDKPVSHAAPPAPGPLPLPGDSTKVRELLKSARWMHEPTPIIKQAVRLLDEKIDRNPRDKEAWLDLGEALFIGIANSKHAASAADAWRKAYDLDPRDCHAGALVARSVERTDAEQVIRELERRHPQCPEVLYLTALFSLDSGPPRVRMLQQSIALANSAEALIALGHEWIHQKEWQSALQAFGRALNAPALFPEDWRPDGWAQVHARLGLAWSHFSQGEMGAARREYTAFMTWFTDPGPWHDLSETEEVWRQKLAARWPGISGMVAE